MFGTGSVIKQTGIDTEEKNRYRVACESGGGDDRYVMIMMG